jgi:hypothetical protein
VCDATAAILLQLHYSCHTTATGGLGGEGNRWTAAVASLTDELNKLAGDVLVVSHLAKLSL